MIVTESQVNQALQHYGRVHQVSQGAPDKITLPRECSKLADLLGVMWFEHEREARVPNSSRLAALVVAAFGIDEGQVQGHADATVRLEQAAGGGWQLTGSGGDAAAAQPAVSPPQPPLAPQAAAAVPEPSDAFESTELKACPMRNNGDEICESCQ